MRVGPLRRHALVCLAAVVACQRAHRDSATDTLDPASLAVTLDFVIGADPADSADHSFGFVRDLHIARDGRLWVLEDQAGLGHNGPHRLLVFDTLGGFVQEVGRTGDGPGEFRVPIRITELPDGRMVLRDLGSPPRITIYDPTGRFLSDWRLPSSTHAVIGGRSGLEVDREGRLWLLATERPSPAGRQLEYLRYSAEGTFLGRTLAPAVASTGNDLELAIPLANGGSSRVGWELPFRPTEHWAWGPHGTFAMINTAEYRVTFVEMEVTDDPRGADPVPGAGRRRSPDPITRRVEAVRVTDLERNERREALRLQVHRHPGGEALRIPEVAETKPPLRGVSFSQDGRLMVMVATASERVEGEWREPESYDLFDQDGRLEGRVAFPPEFRLVRLAGNRACGIVTGADDVESVRCYRIGGRRG